MTLFCLLFPAFFSAYIYKKVKENATLADVFVHYGISTVVSNGIVFMALIATSGLGYTMYLDSSPLSFVLKVLGLSIFINIVFSTIYCCIAKRIEVKMSIKLEK